MRREAGAHLWDAAEAAQLVREFTGGKTEAEFTSDLLIRSAVERQHEIVWRAATTSIPALIPVLDELVDEARGAAGL